MSNTTEEKEITWSGNVYDNSFFGHHCNLVATELINIIEVKENMKVLDAGCGTGAITLQLLEKFKGNINLTSFDYSPAMIELLHQVKKKHNSQSQKLPKEFTTNSFVASLEDLEKLQDNHFDVIFCNMVLFFVKDKSKALNELKRVAKKGAKY
jgi:ubiquinone/menaquinone biosynthesis C-methylase UbiE